MSQKLKELEAEMNEVKEFFLSEKALFNLVNLNISSSLKLDFNKI
jgi:hypothetical protein